MSASERAELSSPSAGRRFGVALCVPPAAKRMQARLIVAQPGKSSRRVASNSSEHRGPNIGEEWMKLCYADSDSTRLSTPLLRIQRRSAVFIERPPVTHAVAIPGALT